MYLKPRDTGFNSTIRGYWGLPFCPIKGNPMVMVENDTEMKQGHLTLIICADIWFVLPDPPDGDI